MAWKTINGTCYTVNGSVASGYNYKVEIDYSQSITNNQSTVTVKSFIQSKGSHQTISSQWKGTVCGTTGSTQNLDVGPETTWYQLGSTKTITVNHNADGTGSFSCSASYTNGLTSNSTYTTKSGSISTQTVSLPTIPRASSIGTISGTKIGSSMTVNISRNSSSFTHNVRLHFGNYNSTIATGAGTSATFTLPLDLIKQIPAGSSGSGYIYVQTKNGSSNVGSEVGKAVTLSAPISTVSNLATTELGKPLTVNISKGNSSSSITHDIWLLYGSTNTKIATGVATGTTYTLPITLATQTPSDTSGSGNVQVKAYYSGVQLGPTITKPVTLTVPSNIVPSFTELKLTGVNLLSGYYVSGKSSVRAQIMNANGIHGSTIKKQTISGPGLSASVGDASSSILNGSGDLTYTGTITDSRSRSASKTAKITLHGYAAPTISNLKFVRCLSDGAENSSGSYAKVSFSANVYNIANASINAKTWKVEWRVAGGSWAQWSTGTLSGYGGSTVSLSAKSGFDVAKSYEVRVSTTDSYTTISSSGSISTISCAFNIEDGGLGVGKYWEKGGLDVAGTIHTNDEVKAMKGLVATNPGDGHTSSAALNFSDSNVARIRYGGSGSGATNGFNVEGPGDNLKMRVDDSGNILAIGALMTDSGQIRSNNAISLLKRSDSSAQDIRVRSLLTSDAYADASKVPSTGVYAKGEIHSGGHIKTGANMRIGTGGSDVFINNTAANTYLQLTNGGGLTFGGKAIWHEGNRKSPASGDWWSGGFPIVGTDGVMEIGKYIDFHDSDTTTSDYTCRIQGAGDYLYTDGAYISRKNAYNFTARQLATGNAMGVYLQSPDASTKVQFYTPNSNYNAHVYSNSGAVILRGSYAGCRNSADNAYVESRASKFTVNSELKWKSNIKELEYSALDKINNSTIYSYDKIIGNEIEKEIGLVIDYNAPEEVVLERDKVDDRTEEEIAQTPELLNEINNVDTEKFIDLYAMISLGWKAIQELSDENNSLKTENEELKARLSKIEEVLGL